MSSIDIKIENDLLLVTVTGVLSADEAIAVINEYYPTGTIKNTIWDLTNGSLQSISHIGFREIAVAAKIAVAAGSRKGGKTVYIGNSSVENWLLRHYAIIAETSGVPIKYNVFRALEEARQWVCTT